MTAFSATASGKIILFGEHAVVYGQPAIAVPVNIVCARAVVTAAPHAPTGELRLIAPKIQLDAPVDSLEPDHPLGMAVRLTAAHLGASRLPACEIRVSSTIPMAAGFGSSAAISIAIIRALATFTGRELSNAEVSSIAYQVEQRQHGNPSGIDNTVIAFGQPIYFVRGHPFEALVPARPFTLVIGDSGMQSSTADVVGDVRQLHLQKPEFTIPAFEAIGAISRKARTLIQIGQVEGLGDLMNQNQALLRDLTISSPELDRLVEAARNAGALGAKLSGGGRGGNMITLVAPETATGVERALQAAGAVRTWITTVGSTDGSSDGTNNE